MNLHILVIDDDPGTREALVAILDRAGYQITSLAGSDAEIAAACNRRGYQAAVVDYHLPHHDGLEVARQLKQSMPDCRVLLISSEPPSPREISGDPGLVDRFLAKPFSKEAILDALTQLCPSGAP